MISPQELLELVTETRSTRRFKNTRRIDSEILKKLAELARLTPSSRNFQPLKYILINDRQKCADVFSCLNWAAAIAKWGGPNEEERPAGYIVVLGDQELANKEPRPGSSKYSVDPGIAVQTMHLGAKAYGLGSCILASVDRDRFRELFTVDSRYEILLVLALGYPDEQIKIEPMPENGEVKYWRDEQEIHHVPKRSAEEVILAEYLEG